MIVYSELSRVASYEIVGIDDFFNVKNLDPEKNVVAVMKVGDGVNIETDEKLGLDDCSINLGV